jgi:FtsZ-interacting cell division protein YlmF
MKAPREEEGVTERLHELLGLEEEEEEEEQEEEQGEEQGRLRRAEQHQEEEAREHPQPLHISQSAPSCKRVRIRMVEGSLSCRLTGLNPT